MTHFFRLPVAAFLSVCSVLVSAQDTLSLAVSLPDSAEVTVPDTRKERNFRPTKLILPASLIAVGAVGLIHRSPVQRLSHSVHEKVVDAGVRRVKIDDYIQYTPLALNVGLSLCGVKSKHCVRDRILVAGTAYVCTFALANGLKYTVREKRPDSDAHNSFPSGHTATVFTGAEIVRTEFGPWCGLAAYGVATCVGVLRVTNDRHWCHDVIAGAGIGILSARVGYWMLPVWKRMFRFSDPDKGVACIPVYNPSQRSFALNCTLVL